MDLPPSDCIEFLKGLKDDDSVLEKGFAHTVFTGDMGDIKELPEWVGSSVNWDIPGGNALKQLWEQVNKKGQAKFLYGLRIPRKEIDTLIGVWGDKNLAYEIRPEDGNNYHGHILFPKSLQSRHRETICGQLANAFVHLHKQEEENA